MYLSIAVHILVYVCAGWVCLWACIRLCVCSQLKYHWTYMCVVSICKHVIHCCVHVTVCVSGCYLVLDVCVGICVHMCWCVCVFVSLCPCAAVSVPALVLPPLTAAGPARDSPAPPSLLSFIIICHEREPRRMVINKGHLKYKTTTLTLGNISSVEQLVPPLSL